jgi:sugar lactone lactonase YvrE
LTPPRPSSTSPRPNQWYSSQWSYVNVSSCTPGGPTNFPATGVSYLFSYYFGTASIIAVDGYGDVFFVPTSNANNSIAEIACGSAAGTSCNGQPPTGQYASIIAAALPKTPTSLAADAAGDVFYTDGTANVHELIPPYKSGPITIGTGFTQPIGVAIDPSGNLLISDSNGYNGNIYYSTTFTSVLYEIPLESGALNPAHQYIVANKLGIAVSPAVDAAGNVYYTGYPPSQYQNLNELVRGALTVPGVNVGSNSTTNLNYVFNASVTPSTISVDSGTAASPYFSNGGGGSCSAGTAYTAGQSCSLAVKYTPTVPGIQSGAVVLADSSSNALITTALSGTGLGSAITIDPGKQIPTTGTYKQPKGDATDTQGNFYIADAGNNTLVELPNGSTVGTALSTGTVTLSGPSGVAVDGVGNIYIANTGANNIVEIPVLKGVLANASTTTLSISANSTALKSPSGVAVDSLGNLYIADTGNSRIVYVPNLSGTLNTAAAAAYGSGLSGPLGVSVDLNGNVYVADTGNGAIVKLSAPLTSQSQLNVVTGLSSPSAVVADPSGSLIVVNKGNASVEKFPLISGLFGAPTYIGGTIAAPYGVTLDQYGNLIVTDSVNALVTGIGRVQSTLPFGNWNVNATSTPQTATVSDSGTSSLIFKTPDYTTSGATTEFAVSSDGCATAGTVVPGNSCNVTATFTPTKTETNATDTLTFSSNASQTASVALVGTGETINPSTTTLTLTAPSNGTLSAGVSATFTATVGIGAATTTPTGYVTFYVNGSQNGPVVPIAKVGSAYQASLTFPNGLPAGAVTVIAVYSGDTNYSGSQGSINETVVGLNATLTLTAATPYTNPQSANDKPSNATGPSIPLVATLTISSKIIPTGTVKFYSGTLANPSLIGIGTLTPGTGGYQATVSETALRALTGTTGENGSIIANYNLFAVYSGDNFYVPETSPSIPIVIVGAPATQAACVTATTPTCAANTTGATFTITPANPALTISSSKVNGQSSGSVLLTLTSYGGWQGVLNFTCSNLPADAVCAPYPGAPLVTASTPNASTVATPVQFIINTNVPPVVPNAAGIRWWISGFAGLMLLLARRRLKSLGLARLGTVAALALLMIGSIGAATGCSTSGSSTITPVGTTAVQVTVTAAQLVPGTTTGTLQLKDANTGSFTIALTIQ